MKDMESELMTKNIDITLINMHKEIQYENERKLCNEKHG